LVADAAAATACRPADAAVIKQPAKAAAYVVATSVAGVGRPATTVVEMVVHGKGTSAYFPSV
jgi:hypothetical protein